MSEFLLGIDLGSSSVKASLVEADTGRVLASAFEPSSEMPIDAVHPGWAEQDPDMWWRYTVEAIRKVTSGQDSAMIRAIGISYQMHGLVLMDKEANVLRPSIIWCDSRAISAGDTLEDRLGKSYCFENLLNLPGNFTAAKLAWVMKHEPEVFSRTRHFMLPGDYLAYMLTGDIRTTSTGLSEGIFWNFREGRPDSRLIGLLKLDETMIPDLVPEFGIQGYLSKEAAEVLGLQPGIPLTYRAGDQPNNALSLKVSEPGQAAATAGTSGVIYAVTDAPVADNASRVNTFIHPSNRTSGNGVLLCVNGTGIAYNWIRRMTVGNDISYDQMNTIAASAKPGAKDLMFFPFGNGAERMLGNSMGLSGFYGLDFNRHDRSDLFRSVQEGICFAMYYGFEILNSLHISPGVIRVSDANMFKSDLFTQIFTDLTGCQVEIYDTDGARGAALAAGVGLGIYPSMQDIPLERKKVFVPVDRENYLKLYGRWKEVLNKTS